MEKGDRVRGHNGHNSACWYQYPRRVDWGLGLEMATDRLHDDSSDKDGDVEVGDMVQGFSWPPRCYTCTYCKREFKSAQALGGHMNVHRRDRARLKQMSTSSQNFTSNYGSLFKLNLHQNPNSNSSSNPSLLPNLSSNLASTTSMLNPSSPSTPNPPHPPHPSYCLHDKGGENLLMIKSQTSGFEFCKFLGFPCENEGKIATNSEIMLLGGSKCEDLDLELRLGCS